MLGSSSVQWDLRLPAGGKSSWQMNMYAADGVSPYLVSGHTYEYVVRSSSTDTSPTPLIRFESDNPTTPVPASGGLITVTSGAAQAFLTLAWYPAATASLAPAVYYHALWQDYADPINRACLWWGQLMLDAAAQP